MFTVRIRTIVIGLFGALALAGCSNYGRGGYGGVSVGMGTGGYYDPYYDAYGYGGWYDDYYYPGNGYYIYDRRGARHRMRDRDRAYWARVREERGQRPEVNNNVSAQSVHDAVQARSGRNRGQSQGIRNQSQAQQRPSVRASRPVIRESRPAVRNDNVSAQSVHDAVRARSAPRSSGARGRDRR